MTITTQVFVGRGPEIAAITAETDLARTGRPRLVLVEGPPGIGKSALVRRALDGAAGFRVLRAGGDETEKAIAYGVASQLTDTPFPTEAGAAAVGTALLGALGATGEHGEHAPVAVVVDDAQWADSTSLQALTFALRRLRTGRVLTVVVVPEAADLPEGPRRLFTREASLRIRPAGLTTDELGELGALLGHGRLDASALARLRSHTGGNPLYATAVLRQTPPDVLADPDADLPAPDAYARAVLAALGAAGEDARRLVRAASVFGESCALRDAAWVAGLRDPMDAVEEAVARGLLTCGYAGGETRAGFPHPLVRASVRQSLGPRERSRAHWVAAALTGRGGPRPWGDDLVEARRELAETVARERSVPHRLLATALLSATEYRLGRWDEAIALGAAVLSAEEDHDQVWLTPYVHATRALPYAARGELGPARAEVEAARRHPLTVAAAWFVAHAEGWIATVAGDPEAVVAVLAPLTETNGPAELMDAEVIPWRGLLADALTALGRYDEAEAVLVAYEKAGRDQPPAGAARARGTWFAARGRTADAVASFEQALDHIGRTAMPFERAWIELTYGEFLRRTHGRNGAAARLASARSTLERLGAVPFLDRCDRELAACGRAGPVPGPVAALTPQERAVAGFVLTGMANKQIARTMGLSVKTIEYHLGHVYAKLGVNSRTALAARLRKQP